MKKISIARDIFEKKERERQFIPIMNLNLSPQKIEIVKKLISDEIKRNKNEDKIDKIKKFMGSIFAMLVIFAAILGSIWLIKFFIGGILG